MEEIEGITNVRGGEGLEWETPIIPGGRVNKNEAIVCTPYDRGITKINVHVDLVKVAVESMGNRAIRICFV